MKKLTAVNWIKNKIEEYGDPENLIISWEDFDDLINQAKEKEKEQIEKAYKSADECVWGSDKIAEEYYNETYGTTKQ